MEQIPSAIVGGGEKSPPEDIQTRILALKDELRRLDQVLTKDDAKSGVYGMRFGRLWEIPRFHQTLQIAQTKKSPARIKQNLR